MGGRGSGGSGGARGGGGGIKASQEALNEAFGALPEGYRTASKTILDSYYQGQINNTEKALKRTQDQYTDLYQSYMQGTFRGKMGESKVLHMLTELDHRTSQLSVLLKKQQRAYTVWKQYNR